MRRLTRHLATSVACGALIIGGVACSGDEGSGSTPDATSNPVGDGTIDGLDPLAYAIFEPPATPQCVALGRRFAIDLDANPSEGLQWRVVAPAVGPTESSIVVPGGSEFLLEQESETETQRLIFAAASLGEVEITARYVRPDGSPVADVVEQTWAITVTEDGACPLPPLTATTIADET